MAYKHWSLTGDGCVKGGVSMTVDAVDLEMQQYLFDLQGYLVLENVLSPADVATLNVGRRHEKGSGERRR
jgi:hypothetical protein